MHRHDGTNPDRGQRQSDPTRKDAENESEGSGYLDHNSRISQGLWQTEAPEELRCACRCEHEELQTCMRQEQDAKRTRRRKAAYGIVRWSVIIEPPG